MIQLDILSDPICPWCFIGKTYLDQALAEAPGAPFAIQWHPFMLNPDMPSEGMDRRAYLEAKFGGQKGAIEVYSQIDRAAREAGIEINFEAIRRTPNTLDAHRLIHWAGLESRQNAMVNALFHAFFLEGRDIGAHRELVAIASQVGMDGDVVQRLLAGEEDKANIIERDKQARDMGVRSVPTFIVAGQAVVPGAQKPDFWKGIIADIEAGSGTDDLRA